MADANKIENIYELLDIDPSIKLTAADARRQITDARAKWNKESGFPGHKGEAARIKRDQWKRLSDDLQYDTISDEQLEANLDRHRSARLSAYKQANAAVRAQLAGEVKFAALKGNILQREIDAWADAYHIVASRDTIEAMAIPYRVIERDDSQLSVDKLDAIDKSLQSLGIESIFSLVELPLSASDVDVKNAAEELYTKAAKQARADWTIKKNLSGDAKVIFSNATLARQYRDHVRQQRFYRAYLESVAVTCDATHKITDPQVDYLLGLAAKDHWNRDEAIEALFVIASQRGWRVSPPATGMSDNERRLLDDFKQQLAQREKQVADAIQRAATTQAEKDRLERAFRESERRFAKAQANAKVEQERLERELREAEKHAQAEAKEGQMKSADARQREEAARAEAQRFRQELAESKRREAENERERISEVGPLLAGYMTRAELVAAQGIIKSFATLPPQWTEYARRIEPDMAEAKRLLDEAMRAMPVERAEALVDEALAKCVDYEPARAFKASLLPAPPSGLTARCERGEVVLTWNPSPSQLVRYIVVRSVGSRPLSTRDGNRMAAVGECAWRDTDAPPARPLYYAVFTERNAMTSQLVVVETAVTILPDVSDVQTEASDATITLSWRLPGKAHAVRVIRNDAHVPQSISDGQAFSLGQTSRFMDTGLINGRQYFYRVYCEYTGLDGQILRSEGVGAYAIPALPPSVVPALTMRGVDGITNHTVYLDFAEPERGSLVIYRTTEAPPVLAGTTLPSTRYKEIFSFDCHEVISKRDTLLSPGAYTYTPVILFQQTAFVGKPQPYLYAPNVRSLKVADDPANGIQLRWRWPSLKCDIVEVRSQPVAASETIPSVVQVNRAGSEDGICVLRNLPRGEYKISVRARYQFKGQIVYSSEEVVHVIHVAPVRVRYRLERAHGFMSRRTVLVLTADQPISLPDIRIVYGRGPLTAPGDGRTLCDYSPDSPLPASTWTVNLSDLPSEPDAQVHVFRKHETTETDIIFQGE